MNAILEFFPLLVFVGAYYFADIFTATAVAIVASVVQVAIFWFRDRTVKKSHLITLAVIVVFGGLTLFLQDETFIKWKFTVVSWLFALAIFGSHFIGNKTMVERMMGATLELPTFVWARANAAMGSLMLVEGVVNIYVLYNFDTDTWFNIKLYGMTAVTMLFMLALGFYLAKHVKDETDITTATATLPIEKQDEEK
ncbi:MAG: septation protein A [Ectothiorhodospiraceae bacterium]|nr:septation protein A [Ectothiorhodospiraceae bacterium]